MCFSLVFVLTRLWDILHCKCWNTCLHSYTTITDQNTYFNNLNAVQLLTDKCKCILKIIKITNQAFCTDIFSGQREGSKSNKTFWLYSKLSCFTPSLKELFSPHCLYVAWHLLTHSLCRVVYSVVLLNSALALWWKRRTLYDNSIPYNCKLPLAVFAKPFRVWSY